jgi:hypothetical protein
MLLRSLDTSPQEHGPYFIARGDKLELAIRHLLIIYERLLQSSKLRHANHRENSEPTIAITTPDKDVHEN